MLSCRAMSRGWWFSSSGINETILKYVTEEIAQTEEIVKHALEYRLAEGIPADANDLKAPIQGFTKKCWR